MLKKNILMSSGKKNTLQAILIWLLIIIVLMIVWRKIIEKWQYYNVHIKNETLQEKWENEEGIRTVSFSWWFENLNEISKKATDAKYYTKEYQRALFKNEIIYFDFTSEEFTKNTKIKLKVYTWNIYVVFENLDNTNQTKTITFTPEDNIKSFSFDDYWMLWKNWDIQTLSIRTDSEIAILDYSIEINE